MAEFDEILKELGWSRAELARQIDVHRNTVSRWKQPPKLVMMYLRALSGPRRELNDLKATLRRLADE